jgi:hypothetical protein
MEFQNDFIYQRRIFIYQLIFLSLNYPHILLNCHFRFLYEIGGLVDEGSLLIHSNKTLTIFPDNIGPEIELDPCGFI